MQKEEKQSMGVFGACRFLSNIVTAIAFRLLSALNIESTLPWSSPYELGIPLYSFCSMQQQEVHQQRTREECTLLW